MRLYSCVVGPAWVITGSDPLESSTWMFVMVMHGLISAISASSTFGDEVPFFRSLANGAVHSASNSSVVSSKEIDSMDVYNLHQLHVQFPSTIWIPLRVCSPISSS
jgi:hypothetical protein